MQLIAIGFSTVRWQRLLVGQGIFPKWGFLGGSIMIARFWGAFTPGGFTGFGGWRIYDVAEAHRQDRPRNRHHRCRDDPRPARVRRGGHAGSIFGMRFIGTDGVLLVNALFLSIIVVGLAFLAQPQLFLFFTRFVPEGIRARVQNFDRRRRRVPGQSRPSDSSRRPRRGHTRLQQPDLRLRGARARRRVGHRRGVLRLIIADPCNPHSGIDQRNRPS